LEPRFAWFYCAANTRRKHEGPLIQRPFAYAFSAGFMTHGTMCTMRIAARA
jgi:hypothetical protein